MPSFLEVPSKDAHFKECGYSPVVRQLLQTTLFPDHVIQLDQQRLQFRGMLHFLARHNKQSCQIDACVFVRLDLEKNKNFFEKYRTEKAIP
jgi:hypothetical protein